MWTFLTLTYHRVKEVSSLVLLVRVSPRFQNIALKIGQRGIQIAEHLLSTRSHISRPPIMHLAYLSNLAGFTQPCGQVKQLPTLCDYPLEMVQLGGDLKTHGGYAEPLLLKIGD